MTDIMRFISPISYIIDILSSFGMRIAIVILIILIARRYK